MGDRKWEELPVDCLVNIFTRVGLVSLVEDVPLVCKPWYQATRHPLCWKSLIFPHQFPDSSLLERLFASHDDEWSCYPDLLLEAFVKYVIRRSCGSADLVIFPSRLSITSEVVNCIAEGCPSLKGLALPRTISNSSPVLLNAMCKWKNLDSLIIWSGFLLEEILPQISIHCKEFVWLSACSINVSETLACGIASLLPNLEFLRLRRSWIKRCDLVIIIKGCKKLVHLDVSYCIGFEVDEEILSLAAHIATFNYEGSVIDDDYEDEKLSSRDFDFCDNSD